MATDRICSIPDCGKPVRGKGFCLNHWRRNHLYGHPLAGKTSHGAGLNHLKSLVSKDHPPECIVDWPFVKNQGYPIATLDGQQQHAARILCILQYGPPPEGHVDAAHRCGVRGCINPAHVYWASRQRNQLDRIDHGTSNRGARHGMAKLTDTQVLEINERLKRGDRQQAIADDFGVTRGTVKCINTGVTWGWLTGRG